MHSDSQNLLKVGAATLAERRKAHNMSRPSISESRNNLERTERAIESLIASKNENQGKSIQAPPTDSKLKEYRPTESSSEHTLSIIEKQVDPFEPPKHRYRNQLEIDIVGDDNRAPILRPAPKKLSKEEKQKWNVPKSISNWKNSKGLMLDRAKDNTGRASNSLTNVDKRLDLASALQNASDELTEEATLASNSIDKSGELKRRLLAQKSTVKENEETKDVFDNRLFHQSRKRTDEYDSDLFTSKRAKMRSKLKHNEVEFEPAK